MNRQWWEIIHAKNTPNGIHCCLPYDVNVTKSFKSDNYSMLSTSNLREYFRLNDDVKNEFRSSVIKFQDTKEATRHCNSKKDRHTQKEGQNAKNDSQNTTLEDLA